MMKLVYITSSSFIDGDFPLIKHLIEMGVEVYLYIHIRSNNLKSTLFNIEKGYPNSGVFDSNIYGDEIDRFKTYLGLEKIQIINTQSDDGLKTKFGLYREELRHIKQINPDVVHFIGLPELYELPLIYKFPQKTIITVHDPVPHKIDWHARKMRLVRLSTNWIVRRYILLNPSMTEEFCKYYWVSRNKVRYSRLGNYDVLNLYGRTEHIKQRIILFVGRISEYKGVEYLLEAYSNIMYSFPDTMLIVAGAGDYHFNISKYQNNPQIEIVNRYIDMEEMGYYFKNCEFVVCPYVSATQSGVVVSALAVNKPVVVTNVGGLPSMINDGKSGVIVPPKDTIALSNAIKQLLSNPTQLKEMRRFIAKDAIDGPNAWAKIAENYLNIYNEIISQLK